MIGLESGFVLDYSGKHLHFRGPYNAPLNGNECSGPGFGLRFLKSQTVLVLLFLIFFVWLKMAGQISVILVTAVKVFGLFCAVG